MSEENEAPDEDAAATTPEATDLDFGDVIDFFKAAGVESPCPCCGSEKWDLTIGATTDGMTRVPTIPTLLEGKSSSGLSATRHFPVIFAICKRCAFTRMHARKKIMTWVKNGKPEIPRNE